MLHRTNEILHASNLVNNALAYYRGKLETKRKLFSQKVIYSIKFNKCVET